MPNVVLARLKAEGEQLAPEVVELPEGWHEGEPDFPSEAIALEMVKLYEAGHYLQWIANKFNVGRALVKREVGIRTPLRRGTAIPAPPTIVDDYRFDPNFTKLSKKHGVAPNTARKWLLDAGVVLRDPRRPAPPTASDEFRAGASVHNLAVKYQVSPHTARRWMVAAGLLAPLQQGGRW